MWKIHITEPGFYEDPVNYGWWEIELVAAKTNWDYPVLMPGVSIYKDDFGGWPHRRWVVLDGDYFDKNVPIGEDTFMFVDWDNITKWLHEKTDWFPNLTDNEWDVTIGLAHETRVHGPGGPDTAVADLHFKDFRVAHRV
jgi:hypothetical protein